MNNKKFKIILSICFVLASFSFFNLAKADTTLVYKHVEYRKIGVFRISVPGQPPAPTPTFVCNPFNSNTNFAITSDNINWQGQHATKEEAVAASIASLESCLSTNNYKTPFTVSSSVGFGLYKANTCYTGGPDYKSWAYINESQIVRGTRVVNETTGAWEYTFTGTARQVTYGDLNYYNSTAAKLYRGWGWPTNANQCLTGIYPEDVRLHTTVCNGENSISKCSVVDAVVPTSQAITYEVDLKVNGFDSPAVDPGSDLSMSWTTKEVPQKIIPAITTVSVLGNNATRKSCDTICMENNAGTCTSIGTDAGATNLSANRYSDGVLTSTIQPSTICSYVLRRSTSFAGISSDPIISFSTNCQCTKVTPEVIVSTITSCVASGDWTGSKALGGPQSEIIPVAPANVPAYSYYQGIVFGAPASRTVSSECAQFPASATGCSSKPYFTCSPWVNSSGVFIDSPSASTHINYQGNYATVLEAREATKASLRNCLKSHNYGKLSYTTTVTSASDKDLAFYVGTFSSGAYRGATAQNNTCFIGSWNPLSYNNTGHDVWVYKGSLAGVFNNQLYGSTDACKYSGVFELIKWDGLTTSDALAFNPIYMSSSDCTPDTGGYKPSASQCNSVNQQVFMAQEVKVPEVVYNNANPSKTYTITCDFPGGKVSDTAVVSINDLSVPGAPQILGVTSGVNHGSLPGNTVSWKAPASASPIKAYEVVKYNSCIPKTKTDSEINSDIIAKNALLFRLEPIPLTLEFKDSFVTSGTQYTYAIRTENQLGGKGPFAISDCTAETPARQQLFTLTGSGFKDTMTVSIVNDTTNAVLKCDPSSKDITLNGTQLEINCEITDFTPVGKWNIVVQDGAQTYSSPANVFLSIVPKDNTLPPANISFSAQNPSVINGIISIDSITGKNIGESATVELVSGSDQTKIIPCTTQLSQITGYASDGSVTLTGTEGIKCPTNNLTFDMGEVNDWKVVVKNSPYTNGLSSDLFLAPTTSLACVSDCSASKVCGLDQCGKLCTENGDTGIVTKDTSGKIESIIKSCTYPLGTCSVNSTKTCQGGTYGECKKIDSSIINSYTPALNTFCDEKTDVITNCGTYETKTGTLSCVFPKTCGGGGISNVCGCTATSFTPALNTFCGSKVVSTNCGTFETKTGTLSLAPGQVCFNNSSCTPLTQPQARANKCQTGSPKGAWNCGFVSDGCGGKYSCNANPDGGCSNDAGNCNCAPYLY